MFRKWKRTLDLLHIFRVVYKGAAGIQFPSDQNYLQLCGSYLFNTGQLLRRGRYLVTWAHRKQRHMKANIPEVLKLRFFRMVRLVRLLRYTPEIVILVKGLGVASRCSGGNLVSSHQRPRIS